MKLKISILIGFLIIIQIGGYLVYSKRILFDEITSQICEEFCNNKNAKSIIVFYSNSLKDTSIVLERKGITNLSITNREKSLLKKSLEKKIDYVRFIETDQMLRDSISLPYTIIYFLFTKEDFFVMHTDEEISIFSDTGESYSTVYDRKLIWILFRWFEFEKIGKGQS